MGAAVTPDEHLERLIKGSPRGLTRAELAYRLNQPDRAIRQLIEDAVASGRLPIVCDRTSGGEGRYRLAKMDEIDLVNAEHTELHKRAVSLHRRSKGLLTAFQTYYQGGSLFMADAGELS
jgi:hypothetical protein